MGVLPEKDDAEWSIQFRWLLADEIGFRIPPSDVVGIPPVEKYWHGASQPLP
jgi:hypothetical protein